MADHKPIVLDDHDEDGEAQYQTPPNKIQKVKDLPDKSAGKAIAAA